jgi:hypothetical protein
MTSTTTARAGNGMPATTIEPPDAATARPGEAVRPSVCDSPKADRPFGLSWPRPSPPGGAFFS